MRRYNLAWIETGRKNGKTELMAGIGLLLLGADHEEGAEVYSVAKDREQAAKCFDVARRMLELSGMGGPPRSGKPFTLYPTNKRIVYYKTNSTYEVIAADSLGNLGQNPHGILFDEILAQPNGDLWDTLKTGYGTRRQPLMVAVTTPGADPTSFAKAEHDFSMRVAANPELAPRRLVYIRNAPKDADPGDEEVWKHANPAMGHFLRAQVIRDEYQEAFVGLDGEKPNERAQRPFRQFRMSQWLDTPSEAWVGLDEWDATGLPPETGERMVTEAELKGRRCFIGLVASSTVDLTWIVDVFPPTKTDAVWRCIWRPHLPEESLYGLIQRTKDWPDGGAQTWHDAGKLTLTPGDQIDIDAHVAQLEADISTFDVQQIAHDSHGVIGIIQPIVASHPDLPVAISPNTQGTAILDFERMIRTGIFRHGQHPVVRWEIAHTLVRTTDNGVLRIDRKNSVEDVGAPYAAELAIRRALVTAEAKPGRMVLTYR